MTRKLPVFTFCPRKYTNKVDLFFFQEQKKCFVFRRLKKCCNSDLFRCNHDTNFTNLDLTMETNSESFHFHLKRMLGINLSLVRDAICESDCESGSDSDSDDSVAEKTLPSVFPSGTSDCQKLYLLANLPNALNLKGDSFLCDNRPTKSLPNTGMKCGVALTMNRAVKFLSSKKLSESPPDSQSDSHMASRIN